MQINSTLPKRTLKSGSDGKFYVYYIYHNFFKSVFFETLPGGDAANVPNLPSFFSLPCSARVPTTLASLLFTEHAKLIPTSGPLHMLFPVPGTVFMPN